MKFVNSRQKDFDRDVSQTKGIIIRAYCEANKSSASYSNE